ncbi:hypothetical protein KUTeg_003902 [Tegillarca granosa]|uniref:Programmed cell death protein 2 C-terminal domain-containing protein n=1 Tax=Tegillarca granosa TaxID=220873 RepID=A0ABQ9FQ29_TEGGR|nr:hypothetical protein KUTeg_003902 [Tegillarca granosa]
MKMSQVLLGLKDSEIAEKDKTFYFVNKIGGLPNWIKEDSKIPCCQKCQNVMLLVVQLCCPLEGSPYHRTLYIFTCVNKECWNHPHSWQILRSQVLDTPITKDTKPNKAVSDDDWGVNSGDWGTPDDDWGSDDYVTNSGCDSDHCSSSNAKKESDDWGTDINDWGMDTGDIPNIHEKKEMNQNICQQKNFDHPIGGIQDLNVQKMSQENMEDPSDSVDDINMASLNVHDFEDDEKEIESSSAVKPSDDSLITEESVNNMLGLLATGNQSHSQNQKNVCMHTEYKCLVPYYIEVVEETVYSSAEDTKHVQKLIRQYKQTENIDLQDTENVTSGKGAGGESYEKERAVHGDTVFHKFIKKTSICPQQCIRYQWNGTPLFISTPKDKKALNYKCVHCGEENVYELQLMPALVNVLQIPGMSGPATEFGTIIVFTCRSSCWKHGDNYRREQVLVQSDPDQHLFCK